MPICKTCNEVEVSGRQRICPDCKKAKKRKAATGYKRRNYASEPSKVEPRGVIMDEPQNPLDLAQEAQNRHIDAMTGKRLNMPITSGVGMRYARGAEWLMG